MPDIPDVTGPEVTGAEFRNAMGHFATGVTVITSLGADGRPVGTTANAVSSLSLDPPLVLVCFDRGSLTLQAIRGHGAFAVNILAATQRQLSANFAHRGHAAAWDGVRHRYGLTGSPRLEDVLAALECTVEHCPARRRPRDRRRPCATRRDQRQPRYAARLLPRRVRVAGLVSRERAADEGDRRGGPAGDRRVPARPAPAR